jgi:hypothetical protein
MVHTPKWKEKKLSKLFYRNSFSQAIYMTFNDNKTKKKKVQPLFDKSGKVSGPWQHYQ